MKKVAYWLQKIENFILIATFIIMVICSLAQVVNRNFVHAGISWFEELSRYSMVCMALLAAEAGLRDGTQISITAVTDKMKPSIRKIMLIIAKLIVIIFSIVIFISSFRLLNIQLTTGQVSPGLGISMFVPYLALPVSFGIIIVVQISMIITMIMNLFNKETTNEEGKI